MTRCFCWHQNFVPKGLSAPAPGLYTCIKSWKNVYKMILQREFFETCSKWPKWQEVSVDITILSPGGCLPPTYGYIHLLNHEKSCIKSKVEEIVLKLATNYQVMRPLCWHQNFGPNGLSAPAQGLYIYACIKLWKNIHKIRGQRCCFETCNQWSKW